ncbi:MAG: hypothetical protein ACREJD_05270 [Phycisphaerales bacterium]
MAGASVTKSVACPNCGKFIDKTKIQARNAGLFCDECAAGMRAKPVEKVERQCPACAEPIGEEDVVCAACGFDYRIGYSPKAIDAQTTVNTSKRLCGKCGYDCSKTPEVVRCPECGTGLSFSVSHQRFKEVDLAERTTSKLVHKFLVPLLATAIAIGLYIAFMVATGQSDLISLGLTKMGVRYFALCLVTAMSMMLWLEVELPWPQLLLRLLVVASSGYLAEQIFFDASNVFIAYPFVTIVIIGLLFRNLELEVTDAAILAMINWPVVFLLLMAFPPQLRFK